MKIGINTNESSKPAANQLDGFNTYSKGLCQAFSNRNDIEIFNCPIQKPLQGLLPTSLSTMENQLDLYHAINHIFPKFKHIPMIATIHDAATFRHHKLCNPKFRGLKNWVLKTTAKRATHYITISHSMIPELVTYWKIPEKKISVVYQGIDPSWHNKANEENKLAIKSHYHLPNNYFLFVGRFQPRKNLVNIINAYFKLTEKEKRQCHLVLVGGFLWKDDEIAQCINKAIQSSYVHCLQNIPLSDLQIIYQSGKAFIFPSLYEGFGIPILEAFASNIPLITSNISACPEIAGDAALLVDPYSVEEIYLSMKAILNDETLSKELILKGQQRVKEFTWEKCAEKTMHIYKNVLEG